MPNYNTDFKGCQAFLDSFTDVKKRSIRVRDLLSGYYESNGREAIAERVRDCNNVLQLAEFSDVAHTTKVVHANNCRNRFCTICAMKRARSEGITLMLADSLLDFKYPNRFDRYHLVLSCDNCSGDRLRDTIRGLSSAATRFLRYKTEHYYRRLEVTYNEVADTYHPHLHILVYDDVDRPDWSNYWLRVGSIRRDFVKYLQREKGVLHTHSWAECKSQIVSDDGYLFEMTKYVTKPADITSESVGVLLPACKGLRFASARGAIKELLPLAQRLIDKLREDELMELQQRYEYHLVNYFWQSDAYALISARKRAAGGKPGHGKVLEGSSIVAKMRRLARLYARENNWEGAKRNDT